jgi:hypothetical protein
MDQKKPAEPNLIGFGLNKSFRASARRFDKQDLRPGRLEQHILNRVPRVE